MAATIHDVALKAGVSIGVVSRAFHDYPDINPQTRERVLKAAAELDYFPNINARNLSAKKPPNMGFIVSGFMDGDERDSQTFTVLRGVCKYQTENNLEIAFYAIDSSTQKKKSYTRYCRERNISGVILMGITTDDEYVTELVNAKIPCVAVDVPLTGGNVGWVSSDNIAASKLLTERLIEQGHRKICVIGGKKNTDVHDKRMKGVELAFAEAGLALADDNFIWGNFNEEAAYTAAAGYINRFGVSNCTAFLCFSDLMAFGVMRAVKESGYKIPSDFSVAGFDGLYLTQLTTPSLTTMKQDFFEIGRQAAMLLHKIMQGRTGEHLVVPCTYVLGESIRNIPLS